MTKRKGISTRTRFDVFKRDGFKCLYCGKAPPAVVLHVDHIEAVSKGGGNERANLVTACEECNQGKSNVPLSVKSEPLRDIQARERERFKQVEQYNRWLSEKRKQEELWFEMISRRWIEMGGDDPNQYRIAGHREQTVRMFLKRLPAEMILDALEVAWIRKGNAESHGFLKYFCGVCWHIIKGGG